MSKFDEAKRLTAERYGQEPKPPHVSHAIVIGFLCGALVPGIVLETAGGWQAWTVTILFVAWAAITAAVYLWQRAAWNAWHDRYLRVLEEIDPRDGRS